MIGLAGNVWEWEETASDLSTVSGSSYRGNRGGYWYGTTQFLSASFRFTENPSSENNILASALQLSPFPSQVRCCWERWLQRDCCCAEKREC